MPDDELLREVDKAFAQLRTRIEELAEQHAGAEAALYAKTESEEWKRKARLEYELGYEADYWRRIQEHVENRITTRQDMVDQQVAKREQE